MRLLSPQQVKDAKSKEHEKQAHQGAQIAQTLNKGIKALNEFRDKKDHQREAIQKDFNLFCADIESKKTALLSEVQSLEARKIEAEKPLDEKRKDLTRREEQHNQAREELETEKQEVNALKEQTEKELKNQSELLQTKANELNTQQHALQESKKKLALDKSTFTAHVSREAKILEDRKSFLALKERELANKENELAQREHAVKVLRESLVQKEEELITQKVKLLDERSTLDRAWSELKRKQNV